jgi:hypothetical protein
MSILREEASSKAKAQHALLINGKLVKHLSGCSRIDHDKAVEVFAVLDRGRHTQVPLPLQAMAKLSKVDMARVEEANAVLPVSSRGDSNTNLLDTPEQDCCW